MKIMFFIGSLKLGGAERAVSKLANDWRSRSHEISIVTLCGVEDDFYSLDASITRIGLNLMEPRATLLQKVVLQFRRMYHLPRVIWQVRPDIVISFNTDANILCMETAWLHPCPVLISERTNPERQIIKKLPALIRRVFYPLARKIVFVSQGVADRYPWISKERKAVILNALEKRDIDSSSRNHEIVALGRLMPVKGFDILIRAFASIAERYPDWTLSIYGDGVLKTELQDMIAAQGMTGRVVLKGHTKDPYPILAEAGIFVLSSRYEGFPNSLMEAMSVGAPSISFDCACGPNELLQHRENGLLVPPENEKALAEAISYMIENPSERERMGKNALGINDNLAIDKISAQWGTVIEEVTGKSFS